MDAPDPANAGSKRLGGKRSPASSRAIFWPPWIDGRIPTPLQARLYSNAGLRGSNPITRSLSGVYPIKPCQA